MFESVVLCHMFSEQTIEMLGGVGFICATRLGWSVGGGGWGGVGWGREVWGLENSVLFDCVMLCHLFCSICMRKKTQIVCSITRSLSSFSAFATKCRSATAISFSTLTCLLASSNLKTAEEI